MALIVLIGVFKIGKAILKDILPEFLNRAKAEISVGNCYRYFFSVKYSGDWKKGYDS